MSNSHKGIVVGPGEGLFLSHLGRTRGVVFLRRGVEEANIPVGGSSLRQG